MTMFQHHVIETLDRLESEVTTDVLARLEWAYLPLLQHSRRRPKALLTALSEQPALFIEMLRAVFKPSEDSGAVEPERAIRNERRPSAIRLIGYSTFRTGFQELAKMVQLVPTR